MITKKDIEHAAWLARIELSEEDKEKDISMLNPVLDYFAELDKVNTEDVEPTYHVLPLSNVFREDEPCTPGALTQEEALANAPRKQDGFFKAPRMM